MLLTLALHIGKSVERGISRLYLLMENGVYLELQDGSLIELED